MDAAAASIHQRGIYLVGETVTFRRVTGQAPSVTTVGATVTAIVRDYVSEAPLMDVKREGKITEGGKNIIVLSGDLSAASFPLPLRKNDQVVLASSGEVLNIVQVDPNKRAFADAIELIAVGHLAG